jgi:hypothetical protein
MQVYLQSRLTGFQGHGTVEKKDLKTLPLTFWTKAPSFVRRVSSHCYLNVFMKHWRVFIFLGWGVTSVNIHGFFYRAANDEPHAKLNDFKLVSTLHGTLCLVRAWHCPFGYSTHFYIELLCLKLCRILNKIVKLIPPQEVMFVCVFDNQRDNLKNIARLNTKICRTNGHYIPKNKLIKFWFNLDKN